MISDLLFDLKNPKLTAHRSQNSFVWREPIPVHAPMAAGGPMAVERTIRATVPMSAHVHKLHVRPNLPPLSVLVRVMVLRIACTPSKLMGVWNVTSISMSSRLTQSHDVLLMLASWIGRALASSRVQPAALATHALKDIPLTILGPAKVFSLVTLTSVRLWLVDFI